MAKNKQQTNTHKKSPPKEHTKTKNIQNKKSHNPPKNNNTHTHTHKKKTRTHTHTQKQQEKTKILS